MPHRRSRSPRRVLVGRIQNARSRPQLAIERRSFFRKCTMLRCPLHGKRRLGHTPAPTRWPHVTHSRSRRSANLDDGEMSPALRIPDDQRQLHAPCALDRRLWRGTGVAYENAVHPASFGVTMISLYHSFHDIHSFPHAVRRNEVPTRIGIGKPRASPSTRRSQTEGEETPVEDS